jgi:hypothetical protein
VLYSGWQDADIQNSREPEPAWQGEAEAGGRREMEERVDKNRKSVISLPWHKAM